MNKKEKSVSIEYFFLITQWTIYYHMEKLLVKRRSSNKCAWVILDSIPTFKRAGCNVIVFYKICIAALFVTTKPRKLVRHIHARILNVLHFIVNKLHYTSAIRCNNSYFSTCESSSLQ